MLPTVLEEPEDFNTHSEHPSSKSCKPKSVSCKLPFEVATASNYSSSGFKKPVYIQTSEEFFKSAYFAIAKAMAETKSDIVTETDVPSVTKQPEQPTPHSNGKEVESGGETKVSENGHRSDEEQRKNGTRRYSRSNGGLPRRQQRQGRRRQFSRNFEKARVPSMVTTFVDSPTAVYMQRPNQHQDYLRLKECMKKSYAEKDCKPSLVAANMLLCAKLLEDGSEFERIRTVERMTGCPKTSIEGEDGSTAATPVDGSEEPSQWKVYLIDRGNFSIAEEKHLNFLLAGLGDLDPLATKYTLSDLKLASDTTSEKIEEAREYLEKALLNTKTDCDVYKQPRDNSLNYIDIYVGTDLLNEQMLKFSAVEKKSTTRLGKKESRVSTSSVDDLPMSPTSDENHELEENGRSPGEQSRSDETKDSLEKQDKSSDTVASGDKTASTSPTNSDNRRRRGGGAGGGRGGQRKWFGNRRRPQLPPLQDWSVLNFETGLPLSNISATCELMERADNKVFSPDFIRTEQCFDNKSRVIALTNILLANPRLILVLCVTPENIEDHGELERTGRSLGVCVVCAMASSLSEPSAATATKLLRELQGSLLQSPAILSNQNYGLNGGNRRRRDNRGNNRRMNNRQRGASNGIAWESKDDSDSLLQAIQSLSSAIKNLQEASSTDMEKSPLKADLSTALKNLEDLQTNYKQTRAHCVAALGAATALFSNWPGTVNLVQEMTA